MPFIFIFLLGLCIGSFLNVLIDRLSMGESIMGRSHCDNCKKTLGPVDLVPIVSFLFLRGKCRFCGQKISWQYPLVELVTGLAFVITAIVIPATLVCHPAPLQDLRLDAGSILMDPRFRGDDNCGLAMTISLLGIVSALIVIFFADLKYHIIPDQATGLLMLFSLPLVITPSNPANHLAGAVVTMLVILSLYVLTRGHGMGFGDVKLSLAMGFLLGLKGGLLALYIAFLVGGITGLLLLIFGKKGLKSKIAFGPFLVLGTIIMLFWSDKISVLFETLLGR